MRYLLTGGAGFIGSHLADALVARGDEVLILDDLSTGRRENIDHLLDHPSVEFVEGSVLDAAVVDDCMGSAHACVHLAAAVGVRLVVERPLEALLRNVRGSDRVISAAARHQCKLVFASTSEVYGKNNVGPLSESADAVLGSPFKPRWGYAHAKSFGESLAYAYWEEQGSPVVVARLFNVVGPRQTGAYGMVLPRFVHQALTGRSLTVFGNGTQSRCFAHVQDVVKALVLLTDTEAAEGSVFNVGSAAEVPIVELARRVIERTGSRSGIEFVSYDDAYGKGFEDLWRRTPDTSAIEALTGWRPARDVDDAIDDVIAYLRNDRGRLRLAG
jgi:nucleoside-diphosphate-sugar epimerase